MVTRNSKLLGQILNVIGDLVSSKPEAFNRLEKHFSKALLINAGNTEKVGRYAKKLRLRISKAESSTVLDYIGNRKAAGITINHVEEGINALFNNRFIEPE